MSKHWYIIHTYSGHEAKAMKSLLDRAKAAGMEDKFDEILIPEETVVEIEAGDSLLFFSDGAFEVADAAGNMIGIDGLIEILQGQGYPASDLRMDLLEEELLKYSNAIRLEDDLTFVEVRFRKL